MRPYHARAAGPLSPPGGTAALLNPDALKALLGITCCLLFAGRALQHWFGDPPFRIVLWNQSLLEPWVARFLGMDWETYANSLEVDASINAIVRGFGALYAVCALAVLPWGRWNAWRAALAGAGAFSLFLLFLMYTMEKFMRLGEFLEYACQWTAPILLILAHARPGLSRMAPPLARLAIAGTFIGHGAYAAGLYPVPGNFVDMVILHLGVGEAAALRLLLAMGILDFLVAAGMALPYRWARPFLIYAAAWGAVTALARLYFLFDTTQPDFGALTFLPEVLYRIPHAAIPLWLLLRGGRN